MRATPTSRRSGRDPDAGTRQARSRSAQTWATTHRTRLLARSFVDPVPAISSSKWHLEAARRYEDLGISTAHREECQARLIDVTLRHPWPRPPPSTTNQPTSAS